MGIELGWVKKMKCETGKKYNKFFLTFLNFNNKNNNSCKTTKSRVLREFKANFTDRKAEIFGDPSCNLPGASGVVSAPVSYPIERIIKQLNKMILTEKENAVFSVFKSFKTLFLVFLTFSLSFFKQTYPQSWKTIFVHLFKKSNLLIRSDNNTGLSSSKVLQTTTI